ncbi:MAG: hypothetical protein ACXW4B_06325 [Micavibrio sp.]
MNAFFPAIVALVTVLSLSPAKAETATTEATTDVAVTTTTDAPAVEATTSVAAEAAAPENYTLENGTAVVVEDGNVFTVDEKGVRTPAPDGDHATKEGKTLKVLAGALVPEAAATTQVSVEVKTETTTEDAPATSAE